MSKYGWSVLSVVRRLRRRIAAALVPALLVSLLSGPACPAMADAPTVTVHPAPHEHTAHAQHAAHHTHESTPQPAATGDCPHCPGGHATGNVADAECSVAAAPAVAAHSVPGASFAPAIAHQVPTAPSAVPPLIRAVARDAAAPPASVPLRIRHCTLLI